MRGQQERLAILRRLYGEDAGAIADEVESMLGRRPVTESSAEPWDEKDVWLITYPDQFQEEGTSPLQTLGRVLTAMPWLNGVHVLPFYPWSSDDGFSVIDYLEVDARYGSWTDIEELAAQRRLIVDAVLNHASVQGEWFRGFVDGDPRFAGFFRTAGPDADLADVVRPRTTPLLTEFEGVEGSQWVWTTFSDDQADLDYRNPRVLLAILDVLLSYAEHGAGVIRLDAVALLWKEEGTPSIHLPQTHVIVRFLRSCLDTATPGVLLLSETNVPHGENVSYFGTDSQPEAQIVYQFPLAPLVLHAALTADATPLADWAATLEPPFAGTTFLNFLASHDGVSVRAAEGILSGADIERMVEHSLAAGGRVGWHSDADGKDAPYELHCTWFDLIRHGYSEEEAIARHLATHAVMLSLPGIPAIYVHSLFGSSNDQDGFARSGLGRSLNRKKFDDVAALEGGLAGPGTREARLLAGLSALVALRNSHPGFHPDAEHRILKSPPGVFAVARTAAGGERAVVAVNFVRSDVHWDPPEMLVTMENGGTFQGALAPLSSTWLRSAG